MRGSQSLRKLQRTRLQSSATAAAAPETSTAIPWFSTHGLMVAQLQQIARATGIQTSGPKAALRQRLETELRHCALPWGLRSRSWFLSPLKVDEGEEWQRENDDGDDYGSRGIVRATVDAHMHQDVDNTTMSILSIDIGIQNLAFAHILVRGEQPEPDYDQPSRARAAGNVTLEEEKIEEPPTRPQRIAATLNAWHRLSVANLPVEARRIASCSTSSGRSFTAPTTSSVQGHQERPGEAKNQDGDAEWLSLLSSASFSMHLYAAHAYTLISALLRTYRPSHVLIERQRFRSGGASAVQEWTLRVGVFEGMLYAVLHALKQERTRTAASSSVLWSRFAVHGVEPQRVARYYLVDQVEDGTQDGECAEGALGGTETDQIDSRHDDSGRSAERVRKRKTPRTKKTTSSSRDVKKAKIDIVGKVLVTAKKEALEQEKSKKRGSIPNSKSAVKFYIGDNVDVRNSVDAYLHKWQGMKTKTKNKETDQAEEMSITATTRTLSALSFAEDGSGITQLQQVKDDAIVASPPKKLDDLADCLLQGITWLEWHVMRDWITDKGIDALSIRSGLETDIIARQCTTDRTTCPQLMRRGRLGVVS